MKLIGDKEANPISFVDQLILAILDDLKTETRRVARVNPQWSIPPAQFHNGFLNRFGADDSERLKCPYGKAGDLLWVRERFVCFDGYANLCKISDATYVVFRDGFRKEFDGRPAENGIYEQKERLQHLPENIRWRPPMHLPFWAHRIVLEVNSIRVEKLQQITEEAAVAEGFKADEVGLDKSDRKFDKLVCPQCGGLGIYPANGLGGAVFDADCSLKCDTARGKFRIKWDQINGAREDHYSGKPLTWEFNPYVWVVNFKRVSP